jgi:aryl-alcohol dehydrogenase-like predicted oxidoreductase
LGEIGVLPWRVISKLPPVPDETRDVAAWVQECVRQSLQRLGIPKLYALLVHRSQDLLSPRGDRLYRAMTGVKEGGWVEKIGASVYGPAELEALWPSFRLDLVQGPFNVIDRRLATSGWLARMHASGAEVHTRSVFLQGLLLMATARRPIRFNRWSALWDQWRSWLAECELTPLQACLGFAQAQSDIDRIVVGVDSVQQLREILAASTVSSAIPPDALRSEDLDLIDPVRWGKA